VGQGGLGQDLANEKGEGGSVPSNPRLPSGVIPGAGVQRGGRGTWQERAGQLARSSSRPVLELLRDRGRATWP